MRPAQSENRNPWHLIIFSSCRGLTPLHRSANNNGADPCHPEQIKPRSTFFQQTAPTRQLNHRVYKSTALQADASEIFAASPRNPRRPATPTPANAPQPSRPATWPHTARHFVDVAVGLVAFVASHRRESAVDQGKLAVMQAQLYDKDVIIRKQALELFSQRCFPRILFAKNDYSDST